MSFGLGFLEAGDVAVFWSQSFVHGEQGHWAHSQQDPKSINQIDLDPKSNDDQQNQNVV